MRRRIALALALAACAGPRRAAPPPEPPPARVEVREPERIVVGGEDLELAGKNDEELFAIGQAAFAAADHARAANAFSRVADLFPASRHHAAALYDAGLALQRLGQWRPAEERFRRFQAEYEGPDAIEAAFREAECQYHGGALDAARATLGRLAARRELGAEAHVRALAQLGVVEYEAKDLGAAERSLRAAVAAYADAEQRERLDPHDAAQAQYYLGEVSRAHFDALELFPARPGAAPSSSKVGAGPADEAALSRALEEKSQLLLAAQAHYLRAIRLGHAAWAVAAGERVGLLYDALYAALVGAPIPPGLDPEEREAYRAELRRRTRVLASKAMSAYEQTLAAAQRGGVESRATASAEAALARLRATLAEPAADHPR